MTDSSNQKPASLHGGLMRRSSAAFGKREDPYVEVAPAASRRARLLGLPEEPAAAESGLVDGDGGCVNSSPGGDAAVARPIPRVFVRRLRRRFAVRFGRLIQWVGGSKDRLSKALLNKDNAVQNVTAAELPKTSLPKTRLPKLSLPKPSLLEVRTRAGRFWSAWCRYRSLALSVMRRGFSGGTKGLGRGVGLVFMFLLHLLALAITAPMAWLGYLSLNLIHYARQAVRWLCATAPLAQGHVLHLWNQLRPGITQLASRLRAVTIPQADRRVVAGALGVLIISGLLSLWVFSHDSVPQQATYSRQQEEPGPGAQGPASQPNVSRHAVELTIDPEQPRKTPQGQILPEASEVPAAQETKMAADVEASRSVARLEPKAEERATTGQPGAPAKSISSDKTPGDKAAAWRQYAAAFASQNARPRVVVVIDDLGLKHQATEVLARLPGPLTLAYLPYANNLPEQTAHVRKAGHELLVHMPMEPEGDWADPGPKALLRGVDAAELNRRLLWNLSRFEGFVGINNHMGSGLTKSAPAMELVMSELKRRGMVYLDSRTTAETVAAITAARMALPYAERDIFLDNERNPVAVARQLAKLEAEAQEKGVAIAIGHPYDVTLEALARWLPTLGEKGLVLAPLTSAIDQPGRASGVTTAHASPVQVPATAE